MTIRATDDNEGANAPVRCVVSDLFAMPALTQRKLTPEGYLTAPAKLARTGVQRYTARELGLDKSHGMDAASPVRLYRPHEEVFSPEAIASFEKKPVTVNHPPVDVTADTWKKYAVGDVHGLVADGKYLSGTIIVRDAAAIAAIQAGKAELSNGYSFELDLTPGTSPDGEAYDGVQRRILGNHVAAVDSGRAGASVRIADEQKPNKEKTPMARKVIVDGIGIDLEETHAAIVEKTLTARDAALKSATDASAALEARATKAEGDLKLATDAAAKVVADHAAQVEKLTAQILTADAVEALVEERTKVVADASALVEGIETKGKSVAAIRTETLSKVIAGDTALTSIAVAVLGSKDADKADANDVRKAFDAVVAASKAKATVVGSDAAYGKALAGNGNAETTSTKLTGRAAMMHRMANGGLLPGETNAA